jgi:hypothetical protein
MRRLAAASDDHAVNPRRLAMKRKRENLAADMLHHLQERDRAEHRRRRTRRRVAAAADALAVITLARRIGIRRMRRLALLGAEAYLAHESPRHAHLHR